MPFTAKPSFLIRSVSFAASEGVKHASPGRVMLFIVEECGQLTQVWKKWEGLLEEDEDLDASRKRSSWRGQYRNEYLVPH